jgi:predicted tellurium resistance membrane protein TerC
MAAGITVLFSTALAWAKDAYKPLNNLMNDMAWHNWITHGVADLILFIGLGLILSNANTGERIAPNRLISFLVAAVVVAGAGLFVWYALF